MKSVLDENLKLLYTHKNEWLYGDFHILPIYISTTVTCFMSTHSERHTEIVCIFDASWHFYCICEISSFYRHPAKILCNHLFIWLNKLSVFFQVYLHINVLIIISFVSFIHVNISYNKKSVRFDKQRVLLGPFYCTPGNQ